MASDLFMQLFMDFSHRYWRWIRMKAVNDRSDNVVKKHLKTWICLEGTISPTYFHVKEIYFWNLSVSSSSFSSNPYPVGMEEDQALRGFLWVNIFSDHLYNSLLHFLSIVVSISVSKMLSLGLFVCYISFRSFDFPRNFCGNSYTTLTVFYASFLFHFSYLYRTWPSYKK